MKTREFIKAGLVNNGTKVMVNKGAKYYCGRHSDHTVVGYVQEPFQATCINTPEICIHSNGIKDFEYSHLTCVDINGDEYCIDISHCIYSNVDLQKNVTILI